MKAQYYILRIYTLVYFFAFLTSYAHKATEPAIPSGHKVMKSTPTNNPHVKKFEIDRICQ